jgi:hypothetical protein
MDDSLGHINAHRWWMGLFSSWFINTPDHATGSISAVFPAS